MGGMAIASLVHVMSENLEIKARDSAISAPIVAFSPIFCGINIGDSVLNFSYTLNETLYPRASY